jgi:fatty-acyl-CoA synthase
MQDFPLAISHLLRHGRTVHGLSSEVVTCTSTAPRRASFAEVAARAGRLAGALSAIGVGAGDRVGTLMWNCQEHLEAYLAVPGMGSVLHTLNHRLFPAQLVHIANDGGSRVLMVSESLLPVLAAIRDQLTTVEQVIVVPADGLSSSGFDGALEYPSLVEKAQELRDWPEVDERSAAVVCYTTGTTGTPKGVAYSHRSLFLHALASSGTAALDIRQDDRGLLAVPMFHVNAWGYPYSMWMNGADLLLPDRFLDPASMGAFMAAEDATFAAGVPTIWEGLLSHGQSDPSLRLPALRRVVSGGSGVSRDLAVRFEQQFGAPVLQGWGMTETSSCCAFALPPKQAGGDELDWRLRTGRILPGVEVRVVDRDGLSLPTDGASVGEFEIRGPWITGSYLGGLQADRFREGWLRTGDLGTIDEYGFMQLHDRLGDAIKSGGEWISSVDLEHALVEHPKVAEAAVVAVPDEHWGERPLALVVPARGEVIVPEELEEFLRDRVARWWVPDEWRVVSELPRTSVGKLDKRALRDALVDASPEGST